MSSVPSSKLLVTTPSNISGSSTSGSSGTTSNPSNTSITSNPSHTSNTTKTNTNNTNTTTTTTTITPSDHHPLHYHHPMTRLTTKSHPFFGAVLSPKHAMELTPTLCLQIASALADLNSNSNSNSSNVNSNVNSNNSNSNSSPRLHSPTLGKQSPTITSTATNNATTTPVVVVVAVVVPYTVWITEAWRVLGWAEPSAALFWEMATMYAALIVSQREISTQYYYYNNNDNHHHHHHHSQNTGMNHSQTHSNRYYYPRGIIPPILSCGSTGSVGSHGTSAERTPTHNTTTGTGGGSSSSSHHNTPYHHNHNHNEHHSKKHNHTVSTTSRLPNAVASAKELPVWLVSTFLLLHCEEGALQRNLSGPITPHTLSSLFQPPPPQHLSSETTQVASTSSPLRFGTSTTTATASTSNVSSSSSSLEINTTTAGKMDFSTLFQYPSVLSRTRLHSTWRNDHRHCTAYLLRHLRKVLLLCAISHSKEAQVACLHLASMPTPNDVILSSLTSTMPTSSSSSSSSAAAVLNSNHTNKAKSGNSSSNSNTSNNTTGMTIPMSASHRNYDADEIRRLHDDEHGNVGLQIRLTMEDLECLDFILQPPNGGMIDEPCVRIGELLWQYVYNEPYPPPIASIPLGDVERVLREHLEMELSLDSNSASGLDDSINANTDCDLPKQTRSSKKKGMSRNNDDTTTTTSTTTTEDTTSAMNRLSLSDRRERGSSGGGGDSHSSNNQEKSDMDDIATFCSKEMKYTRLRGTTVLLKPNPPEPPSATASVASGDQSYYHPHNTGGTLPGRLHDLVVTDCSDAHFYLLQPFEHATIAACTGCTIVIGAVAGLLHIVDCEKTTITFAARRVLISSSCDVQSFLFTPSPPLLVGDNRTCQFAPYNTYYDGMREDLLITGLAAPAMNDHSRSDNDALYPLLQCASNKWKQPIELSKLEVPQVTGSSAQSVTSAPLSPGADDRAMTTNMNDTTMQVPVLVPPSEYHILFVPIESESSRLRRLELENGENTSGEGSNHGPVANGTESQYCRLLAEVLQLSPFRLPLEYERSALLKAERMKTIQQSVQKSLSPEQQQRFEEELNRGFRDWLVSSGNLRQVLDLVHMENKEKVEAQ